MNENTITLSYVRREYSEAELRKLLNVPPNAELFTVDKKRSNTNEWIVEYRMEIR